jgi:hypothetical protein
MVATIRGLVESIISPSMSFFYGRDDYNNLQDNVSFPAAFLMPLIYEVIPSKSGYKSKKYEIILLFVEKSELDFDYYDPDNPGKSTAHDAIFTNTDGYIDTFLRLFELAGLTIDFSKDATSIKVDHVVNLFDMNVSGSMLTMTVNCIQTTPAC